MINKSDLGKINEYIWEIPKSYRRDMRVPALIFASEELLEEIFRDRSLEQLVNVTTFPGIQKNAIVMPDAHQGYGFPIGGVAATSYPDGAISPGGIGYDINCGVRLLKSNLLFDQIKPYLENLGKNLYREIPSGVGRGGDIKLDIKKINSVLRGGVNWAFENGYAKRQDLERIESNGVLLNADPDSVSNQAKKRGSDQLGTMGAGNHFVEVGAVEKIYDKKAAKTLGLSENQITVLIHTGSRGLGHQVATDYIQLMLSAMSKYKIVIPDPELACVPFSTPEGKNYFKAMSASANFAWTNRQLITFGVRKVFGKIFGNKGNLDLIYDVAHNMAKIEEHELDKVLRKLIVHRKGATRAFVNQPVIIPGTMGTASYVLLGTKEASRISFGSTCHGAGRRMSRHEAKRKIDSFGLRKELLNQGVRVFVDSLANLSEEAPLAYKNIDSVVDIVDKVGIAKKVVRLKPLVVIKG